MLVGGGVKEAGARRLLPCWALTSTGQRSNLSISSMRLAGTGTVSSPWSTYRRLQLKQYSTATAPERVFLTVKTRTSSTLNVPLAVLNFSRTYQSSQP